MKLEKKIENTLNMYPAFVDPALEKNVVKIIKKEKIGRYYDTEGSRIFNHKFKCVDKSENPDHKKQYRYEVTFDVEPFNISRDSLIPYDEDDRKRFQGWSAEIVVEVDENVDDKNAPVNCVITEVDGGGTNITLPKAVTSVEQHIRLAERELQGVNLSETDLKTAVRFLTFKYRTQKLAKKVPESQKTYNNLLISCDDPEAAKRMADKLFTLMGIAERDVCHVTEARMFDLYKDRRTNFTQYVERFQAIHIYDCKERPYMDADAGTSSSVDRTKAEAEAYVSTWKTLEEYIKKHPTVTVIVSMPGHILKNTFSVNTFISKGLFAETVSVPAITTEEMLEYCLKEFRESSFALSDDFEDAFKDYFLAAYKGSDIKGMEFAKEAVNKVYSMYFSSKRRSRILNSDNVPAYSEGFMSAEDVLAELGRMAGLKNVKKTFQSIYKKYVADPENAAKESHHMMFYGNPGTGKTTVARLAAELLYQAGVIKTHKCVEAAVGDLVSLWKNGTPQKVRTKVQEAMDGVLFIDEAYGLAGENNDSYQQALNELIQAMVTYQDRIVVIMAGYEDKMEDLLKANSGLSSRIAYKIHFDDFSIEELTEIFHQKCNEIGFGLDEEAGPVLEACLTARRLDEFFGNGRDVANLVRDLQGNWSEEYYELICNDADSEVNLPRVFRAKHFENLMPPKQIPTIDSMVGMKTIKEQLGKFRDQVKYLHFIKEIGKAKMPDSYMHMIFMGNPGTGKTTVAKMIADDLYSLGVLKTNRLVVAERKDIVSKYKGETSERISELIKKAVGGVLFIDEAYALVDAGEEGREAIEVLITAMVEHREDTIFIFAGYPKEMTGFLNLNPGIPSRVGYTFVFEDYATDELMQIFKNQMGDAGLEVAEDALPKVSDIMEYFREMPGFGNGRFVERVVSHIIAQRAKREYTKKDYNKIEACDIPEIGEMIETNPMGLKLLDPKKITEEDRLRTAYHEIGHAIAMYELAPSMVMEKVSVRNRAFSLGMVSFKRDFRNRTEDDLKNEITILLAGRSAERVFCGTCDEGCVSDFDHAKTIANDMIDKYGMCEIGQTKYTDILKEGDKEATRLIQRYQRVIESLAKELVSGKEFTGEEFKSAVEKYLQEKCA
ncbi:ATP-dependent Zn proteases [Lachnospiraceae bacterium XBB2008]|nr:ATP-dependent Zn proteases [Lachnospiraceae bacterium XBB2008]